MSSPIPLILNPAAGGGSAGRNWPRLEAILNQEGIAFDLHRTQGPKHARELAQKLSTTSDRLWMIGGDGTVNEVVNGLMDARLAGEEPAAFGVIPATTGNDFARSIGMPLDRLKAVRALQNAEVRPFDMGQVEHDSSGQPEKRYFALACHIGLAAEVGERVNKGSKRIGGTLPFLTALLRMVAGYRGCVLKVTSQGETIFDGPCLAAVLANGERLGGGMKIAPGAVIDDGLLNFVGFGDFALHNRLRHLPRIYPGTHVEVDGIVSQHVASAELEADRPTLLNVDGETIGILPARVTLLPGTLRVLIPRE